MKTVFPLLSVFVFVSAFVANAQTPAFLSEGKVFDIDLTNESRIINAKVEGFEETPNGSAWIKVACEALSRAGGTEFFRGGTQTFWLNLDRVIAFHEVPPAERIRREASDARKKAEEAVAPDKATDEVREERGESRGDVEEKANKATDSFENAAISPWTRPRYFAGS